MGHEPKDLSHIQQGWRHRTHTEIKCIAGRIPEAQSSGKQVLIPVNRLLGQENGIINPGSPPVTPISREKSVNPVYPFDRTVPHLAGRERPAQILANPRVLLGKGMKLAPDFCRVSINPGPSDVIRRNWS
ncbi:hypothetical protein L3X38_038008 [Prunus dulcis]|uniref:Uncharacterized protein n=1 Tax=Prunus dulcis TaxID=3755 RepID=A0AAD4V487_PRUDU|nr:hypothetical protein L3X38_038008 [Prunus dulcis]